MRDTPFSLRLMAAERKTLQAAADRCFAHVAPGRRLGPWIVRAALAVAKQDLNECRRLSEGR